MSGFFLTYLGSLKWDVLYPNGNVNFFKGCKSKNGMGRCEKDKNLLRFSFLAFFCGRLSDGYSSKAETIYLPSVASYDEIPTFNKSYNLMHKKTEKSILRFFFHKKFEKQF